MNTLCFFNHSYTFILLWVCSGDLDFLYEKEMAYLVVLG